VYLYHILFTLINISGIDCQKIHGTFKNGLWLIACPSTKNTKINNLGA
jgi:hypothetical protein